MKLRFVILPLTITSMLYSCNKIDKGSDVIHLMKKRYNNTYLKNFTFAQEVCVYDKDSLIKKTIWHEAYSFPNQLIIKFDSLNSGNGYVFNQDTIYVMKNNKVDLKAKDIHDLLILGFDIYEQDYQKTYDKLTEKGYDLSKVCETTLNGRDVYCVGVKNEMDEQNKFYIDKERLCFLKMRNYTHSRYDEAVFENYQMVKGYYIATKVLFYKNGSLMMSEEYYNMNFPDTLDPKIFDYKYFEEARW